jgi:hypothetical protein
MTIRRSMRGMSERKNPNARRVVSYAIWRQTSAGMFDPGRLPYVIDGMNDKGQCVATFCCETEEHARAQARLLWPEAREQIVLPHVG